MRRIGLMLVMALLAAACSGGSGEGTTTIAPTTSAPATTQAETSTTAAATTTEPPTTLAPSSTTTVAGAAPSPNAAFIAAYGDVGDCLLVAYTGGDFDLDFPPQQVSCDERHDQQVFFVGELDGAAGDPYPGEAILEIVFEELCEEPFVATFGVPSDTAASLEFWGVWPIEADWEAGMRTVKCSVATPGTSDGEPGLIGRADSAGLILPGHLVATVGEIETKDILIWSFGESGEILDVVNLTADDLEINEQLTPPSWSPDLTTIVYAAELPDGNSEIFLVDTATGEKTNLTNDPANDFGPSISPDGTKIAFSSDRNGVETNIFVMGADGSDVTQLSFHDDRDSSPDWSPDGGHIAFRRRTNGNSDIWTMKADGSDPAFLVGGPAGEYDPDWSPDGARVAFISDEDGQFDIWTFPAEGNTILGAPPSLAATGATRVTQHPGNEEFPNWSPDGEFILFLADRHGVQDVWMTRADGSDQTALLFTYPVGFPAAALAAG